MEVSTLVEFVAHVKKVKESGQCGAVFLDLRDNEGHVCREPTGHAGQHKCPCHTALEWWDS